MNTLGARRGGGSAISAARSIFGVTDGKSHEPSDATVPGGWDGRARSVGQRARDQKIR
jgi:hypothetical protein